MYNGLRFEDVKVITNKYIFYFTRIICKNVVKFFSYIIFFVSYI